MSDEESDYASKIDFSYDLEEMNDPDYINRAKVFFYTNPEDYSIEQMSAQ